MRPALWTVRVRHDGDLFEVRSALTPDPMPGDRVRYGHNLELDVVARIVAVGVTGGDPVVECDVHGATDDDVARALAELRFRRVGVA